MSKNGPIITVRLTVAEREKVKAVAARNGLTLNNFCRQRLGLPLIKSVAGRPKGAKDKVKRKAPRREAANVDDVRLVNCAECRKELLAKGERSKLPDRFRDLSEVAGRINDRPYCDGCLELMGGQGDVNANRTPGQKAKIGMTKGG